LHEWALPCKLECATCPELKTWVVPKPFGRKIEEQKNLTNRATDRHTSTKKICVENFSRHKFFSGEKRSR
jgi:hypothetical protein